MRIGLMRVNADRRPDIVIRLGGGDDVTPLALLGRDVEKASNAAKPSILKHFALAFRQSFLDTGSGERAYVAFLGLYVVCLVVTWAVYLRPSPRRLAGV